MMRLVVGKERLFSELAGIAALLRHAKAAAPDCRWKRRLARLINQADGALDECNRYYLAPDVKRGASHPQYLGYPRNIEDFISRAFASAVGLESAKADGFEFPGSLRKKIRTLGQAILPRIHELRSSCR